jgi:hypothetical protein
MFDAFVHGLLSALFNSCNFLWWLTSFYYYRSSVCCDVDVWGDREFVTRPSTRLYICLPGVEGETPRRRRAGGCEEVAPQAGGRGCELLRPGLWPGRSRWVSFWLPLAPWFAPRSRWTDRTSARRGYTATALHALVHVLRPSDLGSVTKQSGLDLTLGRESFSDTLLYYLVN